jgi:hypothetical protein
MVVASFAEAIEINGIKVHAQIGDDLDTKNIGELVELFVDPARMTHSQNQGTKKYIHGGLHELKGVDAKLTMGKVFLLNSTKQVDLDIGIVKVPITNIGVEEVLAMASVMTFVHEVASSLLVVRTEMKVPTKCITNHVLREDLRQCVSDGIQHCDEGLASIETHTNNLHASESTEAVWAMTPQHARTWMKGSRAALVQVEVAMYSQCVRDLQFLAQVVEKHCPKYSHFCNDTTFSTSLAKNTSLHMLSRTPLVKKLLCSFGASHSSYRSPSTSGCPSPTRTSSAPTSSSMRT